MVVVSISHVDPPNEPSATSLFAIISSIDRLPSSRSTEKLLERVSGSQHDVWPHSLQQGLQLHKSRHGPGPHQYFRHVGLDAARVVGLDAALPLLVTLTMTGYCLHSSMHVHARTTSHSAP